MAIHSQATNGLLDSEPVLEFIRRSLSDLGHGHLEVVVHEGQVVQIRRTDRTRFRDGQIQPNPTNQRTPQ
ncbi:MAG: YezD family protein [Pirellulales bacterium]